MPSGGGRYQEQGLPGMVDHRAGKRMHRTAGPMGRGRGDEPGPSARRPTGRRGPRYSCFRRTRQILAGSGGEPAAKIRRGGPFTACSAGCRAGRHTTMTSSVESISMISPRASCGQLTERPVLGDWTATRGPGRAGRVLACGDPSEQPVERRPGRHRDRIRPYWLARIFPGPPQVEAGCPR